MDQSHSAIKSNLFITPGKKVCRTCQIKIFQLSDSKNNLLDTTLESDTDINFENEDEQDFEISCEEINEDLQSFNISLLKSHSKSEKHTSSIGKRKVAQVTGRLTNLAQQIETHTNIPPQHVNINTKTL